MKRYGAHRGMKEKADGGWVRYEDVQELRASMMALAEFQQMLGDARGFRRALVRNGCTARSVELLVREDRA